MLPVVDGAGRRRACRSASTRCGPRWPRRRSSAGAGRQRRVRRAGRRRDARRRSAALRRAVHLHALARALDARCSSRRSTTTWSRTCAPSSRRGSGRAWRRASTRRRSSLDPGLGFAKTAEHNWALLRRLDELHALGCPLLVGASRKRFLGALLADADGSPRPPTGATTRPRRSALSAYLPAPGACASTTSPDLDAVRGRRPGAHGSRRP